MGSFILQFLIAVILMTAFNPWVNRIERIKVGGFSLGRSASIIVLYALLFLVAGVFVAVITQPLIVQSSNLAKQFPVLWKRIDSLGFGENIVEQQISQLSTLPTDIFRLLTGVFSNILGVFTTLVMTFYLLLERKNLHKYLTSLFENEKLEKRAEEFINHLEDNLGGWVRAELLLMLIVGCMTYVGLLFLKIPFALPLAIIAGLLELIPGIGPTISAIPAVIIALLISPVVSIGVAALYVLVQLLENNFIVPQVMSKTVGVNPLVTIVALLLGLELGGVKGAILAVPIVLLCRAVIKYFFVGRFNGLR